MPVMIRRFIFLVFLFCMVLLVFSITHLTSMFLLFSSQGEIISLIDDSSFEYQYLEQNSEGGYEGRGYISISNIEGENEFLTYREESDSDNIFTSSFGEVEYECIGSCFCDNSFRRASMPLISRSISYLLVSISSVTAISQAQEYFKTKCQEEFSQECDESSSVKSSIESCSPINEINGETKDTYFEDRENEERRVYFCFGNCVPNQHGTKWGTNREESSRIYSEEIDCGTLKQEGEVILYESDLIVRTPNDPLHQKFRKSAAPKFQQFYLTDFCKENSKVDYIWEGTTTNSKTGKIYPSRVKRTGFACIGASGNQGGKKSKYKNVKCRQIEPEPTSNNSKYYDKKFRERKEEWDDGEAL